MDGIDTRALVSAPTTANEFKGKVDPDWCAGCGDFGVLNSLRKTCLDLGLKPHEILTVSGIGCSSNFPGFFNSYGMHTLHGRALPVATGAKMANQDLTVIVTGGDGDGYGIGGNHFTYNNIPTMWFFYTSFLGVFFLVIQSYDSTTNICNS